MFRQMGYRDLSRETRPFPMESPNGLSELELFPAAPKLDPFFPGGLLDDLHGRRLILDRRRERTRFQDAGLFPRDLFDRRPQDVSVFQTDRRDEGYRRE